MLLSSMFSLAFAVTRTGYYKKGETKINMMLKAADYEMLLKTAGYTISSQSQKSASDYTQNWALNNDGSKTLATVHYEFYDDKVVVTLYDGAFVFDGKKIPVSADSSNETFRKIHQSLEDVYINTFFKKIGVTEKAAASKTQNAAAGTYEGITVDLVRGETKEKIKTSSKQYVDYVLAEECKVTYLSDKNADDQNIKYILEDADGVVTVVVKYQFRDKSFAINITSLDYFSKVKGSRMIISKESPSEAAQKFYKYCIQYFVTNHATHNAQGSVILRKK